MKILLIGQCTLHWGRMEFGNIGNYYIIEPFIRELHRVFPDADIATTFQMSDDFCKREHITCLPMKLYYAWSDRDLPTALEEYGIAKLYAECKILVRTTPYIEAVLSSDIVIDFSGDIWGDNADLVGENRFMVGLLKDRVAQLLGKPTVMLAGSPGPFAAQECMGFAREVFSHFDLVTNREAISIELLKNDGFDVSNVESLACPAFLFESKTDEEMKAVYEEEGLCQKQKPSVGLILCGWNMLEAPYSKWPRDESEYESFVQAVEFMIQHLGVRVYFMSHSNGFNLPPHFKHIHGRDYPIAEQLYTILSRRGYASDVSLIRGIYSPAETKAIVRQFDMMVSGRIHAAVAALSQCIPTVIIDYGHEPKAHKLRGFANVAGVGDLIANPSNLEELTAKIGSAWNRRVCLADELKKRIPVVQQLARANFDLTAQMLNLSSSHTNGEREQH